MKSASPITKKNRSMPAQGIHGDMAGTTVIVRGVEAVSFPLVASIAAVKFCGAAAGVASTMSNVLIVCCVRGAHVGRNVRLNPELGNPSSLKHTCGPETPEMVVVRLTDALSPTLIVTAEGSSVKPRLISFTFEACTVPRAGQE
jgi:hypothetical protein